MPRGFQAHPPSIHAHANRTGQRADQVSQSGSTLGGAGLHGTALGLVGSSTAGQHQQLASRGQSSVSQAGSRLQGQAGLLHQTGNNITDTDSDNAGRLRAINPPVNRTRNPRAQSGAATSRSNNRTSRPAPRRNCRTTGATASRTRRTRRPSGSRTIGATAASSTTSPGRTATATTSVRRRIR